MPSVKTELELDSLDIAIAIQDPLGLAPLPVDNRKRFLKFVLSKDQETLLPLDRVLEVMQILPESILSVPNMSNCILGVCIWKGETLWLVDLNTLVGYEALYQQSHRLETASVIIVQYQGQTLGLVVKQIDDIELFDENKILTGTGLCPPELESFILGHLPQQGGSVLDTASIFGAPELHTYH
jgi:chemotaxis signal transduction protein